MIKCSACETNRPEGEFVGRRGKPRKYCERCAETRAAYAKANYEKLREYRKAWHERNPGRNAALKKAHREKNIEEYRSRARAYEKDNHKRLRERRLAYNARNKDRRAAARRLFNEQHPGLILKQGREWKQANPELVKAHDRNKRASRRKAKGKHSAHDVQWLFAQQGGRCEACRKKLIANGPGKYQIDHMHPLSLGGSNDVSNLQLLCPTCNNRKHAMPYEEWCSRLGRLPFLVSKVS